MDGTHLFRDDLVHCTLPLQQRLAFKHAGNNDGFKLGATPTITGILHLLQKARELEDEGNGQTFRAMGFGWHLVYAPHALASIPTP